MKTVTGQVDGKVVGYMKITDGQEFLLRESHIASWSERLMMYQLFMSIYKEAKNDDRPNPWQVRKMLLWSLVLKPTAKACSYERIDTASNK